MGSRSHHADYLSASQKFGLVAGNFLLTPLLGVVFYYAWRKDFPKSAKFANRSAWLCFGGIILLSILWNTILANKVAGLLGGVAKNSELAAIATEDREAMTKLYDDIQAFELDENNRVAVLVYPPLNPFFVFNDDAASALGELRKLKKLRLPMMSQLGDLGFGKIAQLAELEQLSISGSEACTDEGLQALGELRNLKQLGVAMTGIGTLGMSAVSELEALEFLDLTGTTVDDDAVSKLNGLTNLTILALVGTKITDEALKTLAELPALRELDIRGCNVGDIGMSYLAASKSLENLEAFRTREGGGLITDEGLANLSRLETLKYVNLSGNKISDAAVSSFKEALPNCVVKYEQVKPAPNEVLEQATPRPSEPTEFGIRITQELPPGSGIEKELRLSKLSFKKGRPGRNQLLYMWTNESGQPMVFGETFVSFWDSSGEYILDFSSISQARLTASLRGKEIWLPDGSDVIRNPISTEKSVDKDAESRIEQMRNLASRFTSKANLVDDYELKLNPQEFYRYSSLDSGIEDGAVFFFEAGGGDPEVVLVLEAVREGNQELRCYYSLVPLGSGEFKVAFDERQVWHSPRAFANVGKISEPYFLTVNRYRASTVSDTLPLANFSELTSLDLKDTSIADRDLTRLANSQQLRDLNLDGTNVSAVILEDLADVDLARLGIGVDAISDEDLQLLSSFKGLEWLSLEGAPVTDAGVAHLLKLPKLKTLDISGTQISAEGIEQLGSLPGLSRLKLSRIEVTEELLAALATVPGLKELELSNTLLDDNHLDALGNLKSLQRINLENTLVTKSGHRRLVEALPNCEIRWGVKHSAKAIPVQIAARHKDRAERYRERKDWKNAKLELEASIAAFADYAPNWMELLDILYWEDASFASRNEVYNKAQKALRQETDQLKVLFFHAGWCLLSDNQANYDELCKEAIERFSRSGNPQVQALLAWLFALDPNRKTEHAIKTVQQDSSERDTRAALAVCLIRSGRSEDAIEHCENELERSLAFLRMNDLVQARKAFEKFRTSLKNSAPKLQPQIHQRLAQRIYLREVAESLEFGPINPKVERAIFSSPKNSLCLSYLPIGDAELPLHLDPLPDLEELHLVSTRVGNDGMAAVGRLEKLRLLELGKTKIDSTGLNHLSNLNALEILTLHFTDFSDSGVQHLSQLPRLHLVNVQGTKLTNRGITDLASIETLTWLNAGETKATDIGFSELGKLRDLEFLFLSGSKLTDRGLEALAKLPKLKVLDVRNTQVTAQGIQRLRARIPGCNVLNNATVIPKTGRQ